MAPKKRRQQQQNNKENVSNPSLEPLSIQPIIEENLKEFEAKFNEEYQDSERKIRDKLTLVQKEFDQYLQTHQSQGKLAQLLDQEIGRLNQQQQQTKNVITSQCQELLEKTTDLMNASLADTSRTKTYLIGELQSNGNQ